MRLSNRELFNIALAIRPHITPLIEKRGVVSHEETQDLAKKHAGHAIVSERSVILVQHYLAEI